MARAIKEAEDEAFEASLASGLFGVLTLVGEEQFTIGVHTGIDFGRAVRWCREPAGEFLPRTVRKFKYATVA